MCCSPTHSIHHITATHSLSSAIGNTYTLFIPHQHIPFTTSQQHIHYHQPLATHTPCSYLTNTFTDHSNTFTMLSAISNTYTLFIPHEHIPFTTSQQQYSLSSAISNTYTLFIPHQQFHSSHHRTHSYHQPLATHTPCSYLTNTFHSPHHSNTCTIISH